MEEIKGKTIKSAVFLNGQFYLITEDGIKISVSGGNIDTTYLLIEDKNGNKIVNLTETF